MIIKKTGKVFTKSPLFHDPRVGIGKPTGYYNDDYENFWITSDFYSGINIDEVISFYPVYGNDKKWTVWYGFEHSQQAKIFALLGSIKRVNDRLAMSIINRFYSPFLANSFSIDYCIEHDFFARAAGVGEVTRNNMANAFYRADDGGLFNE